MSTKSEPRTFTAEEVKQRINYVYREGFHAGAKWAKEGGNIERTQRPQQHDRTPTRTTL